MKKTVYKSFIKGMPYVLFLVILYLQAFVLFKWPTVRDNELERILPFFFVMFFLLVIVFMFYDTSKYYKKMANTFLILVIIIQLITFPLSSQLAYAKIENPIRRLPFKYTDNELQYFPRIAPLALESYLDGKTVYTYNIEDIYLLNHSALYLDDQINVAELVYVVEDETELKKMVLSNIDDYMIIHEPQEINKYFNIYLYINEDIKDYEELVLFLDEEKNWYFVPLDILKQRKVSK